jgi:hypothetical protein
VAIQTGAIPSTEVNPKPISVAATTHSANTGSCTWACSGAPRLAGCWSSFLNERLNTSHSIASATSHGSSIRPAKRVNDRPVAWNASRFVRFEIGNSNDAVFARLRARIHVRSRVRR